MNRKEQFCPDETCNDYGKVGKGNISIHSQKEKRYYCKECKGTFAATHGTPLYRLHHERGLFGKVMSLLSHGCPQPAIVATFGLDQLYLGAEHFWGKVEF